MSNLFFLWGEGIYKLISRIFIRWILMAGLDIFGNRWRSSGGVADGNSAVRHPASTPLSFSAFEKANLYCAEGDQIQQAPITTRTTSMADDGECMSLWIFNMSSHGSNAGIEKFKRIICSVTNIFHLNFCYEREVVIIFRPVSIGSYCLRILSFCKTSSFCRTEFVFEIAVHQHKQKRYDVV